ncbi:MAG: hypothetical protein LBH42_03980 [Treponema sp.]|jgi:hypothetical protein|nr:hypothetical protein [Treponema sp.]
MAGSKINFTYPVEKKGIVPKGIAMFEIDAFLVETYNYENRLTNLTVEEGSNISDHVIEEPDTLDIEAFIGATKFETSLGTADPDLSNVEVPDDPKSRIRQAHHELLRMKRERQPVDVVTGLDTLTDMVITSYNFSRDVETGADLPFSMSFQKINTVKSEETQISISPAVMGDQAAGIANVGLVGKTKIYDENSFKESWRRWVREGRATPAEYQEQWGEYP